MSHKQLSIESMSHKSVDPSGCFNCRFNELKGKAPAEWVPGTRYKYSCVAPEREYPSAVSTSFMTEERPDLPICQWWVGV